MTCEQAPVTRKQYWLWVARPEFYAEEDGSDRQDLDPAYQEDDNGWWTCHRDTKRGDLALLWRTAPRSDIGYLLEARSDAFSLAGDEFARQYRWKFGCSYQVRHKFANPVTRADLRATPDLHAWGAYRASFQGQTFSIPPEHWTQLTQLLAAKDRQFATRLKEWGSPVKKVRFLDGEKLYQVRARQALPLLVRQAKAAQTIGYADLAAELGMANPRNLNYVLGTIGEALQQLSSAWAVAIPPIQCVVVNKHTGMPGEGIAWFISDAETFKHSSGKQRGLIVQQMLHDVFRFARWDDVLATFGLEPVRMQRVEAPTNYYYINTDAKDARPNPHETWINKDLAVTSGAARYGHLLGRLKLDDICFMYVNGHGVIAAGTVRKEWDGKGYDSSVVGTNLEENEREYRIEVKWCPTLQGRPISAHALRRIIGWTSSRTLQRIPKEAGEKLLWELHHRAKRIEGEGAGLPEERGALPTPAVSSKYGPAGEGEDHRRLKEFVAQNPAVVGLPAHMGPGITEYEFPSDDRIDVLFRHGSLWVGVEVKARRSDTEDIRRGLYQCVKYRALIHAEQAVAQKPRNGRAILVLEQQFPRALLGEKHTLAVEVFDEVSVPYSNATKDSGILMAQSCRTCAVLPVR